MAIKFEVVEPDEDGRENFAIRGGAMGPALPDLNVVYPLGACMGAALPGLDITCILVTRPSGEFRSFRVITSLFGTCDSVSTNRERMNVPTVMIFG
jgi:hypothetical protein